MKNTQQRVRALIRDVRSGWRRRVLVQGLALTLGVAAAWGIVLLLVRESVSPTLLLAGILLALATVAYLGFRFVARPMMRRIADRDVALPRRAAARPRRSRPPAWARPARRTA